MPSLQDSVVIFILALILVGPKNLPKLARQLGKLMAEFRRASNEFRMQMEDELRVEEQKEHQAKVEAMAGPPSDDPHNLNDAHLASPDTIAAIAESGDLKMLPPATGLPTESSAWGTTPLLDGTTPYVAPETVAPEAVAPHLASIAEPTILPPGHLTTNGMSSDEPAPTAESAAELKEQTHA